MAQYFLDFSGYTTGTTPGDWTLDMGTGSPTVETVSGATSGVALEASTSSPFWKFTYDEASHADIEIVTRFRALSKNNGIGVTARTQGNTSYIAYLWAGDNTINTAYLDDGTWNFVADASFTWSANVWYWLRFRINGTSVQVKIWEDGSAEPGSWTISSTNSNVTGAGTAGFHILESTATIEYDVVGFGTNGDTAPTESLVSFEGSGAAAIPLVEVDSFGETELPSPDGEGDVDIPMQEVGGVMFQEVPVYEGTGDAAFPIQSLFGEGIKHPTGQGDINVPLQSITGDGEVFGYPVDGAGGVTMPLVTIESEGFFWETPPVYAGEGGMTLDLQEHSGAGVFLFTTDPLEVMIGETIQRGGWTTQNQGENLHDSVSAFNDVQFIHSNTTPGLNRTCRLRFEPPPGTIYHPVSLTYRIGKTNITSEVNISVSLYERDTLIASWFHPDVPFEWFNVTQELTQEQFDAVTNWPDLYIEFTANLV